MPSRSLQHLPPHHPLDRRTAARRAGLDAWLAGLARDTGTLSRRCKTTRRNILLKPALSASCRKTNVTENKSGCLVPTPHYAEPGGGSDIVRRQVIQRAAGFARRAGHGVGTRRPRCGPGACPRARPSGSITALGRLAVTPAARAGSPLRTSQHHHDNRAAHVVTLGHRENPGRPGQHA